jgi:hypothetical protein
VRLTIGKASLATALRKGLAVRVTGTPGTRVQVVLRARSAAHGVKRGDALARRTVKLGASGSTLAQVKFSASVRRLLAGERKLSLDIRATASGAAAAALPVVLR